MCIIFIAKNVHPDYPLIIAANRDEFFSRPTQSPHWWPDAPHLFAGKDLQAGGTWLGHNKQNRIAGITNLRRPDLYQTGAKSRGDLVKGFLDVEAGDIDEAIGEYTLFLQSSYDQYNPFNLLFGDSNKLVVFSSATGVAQPLSDGVHSISNGEPNAMWPKMQSGIKALSDYFSSNQNVEIDKVFSVLADKVMAEEVLLPITGISLEEERQLSSIFVPEVNLRGMPYGTRSSSVILVGGSTANNQLQMKTKTIA